MGQLSATVSALPHYPFAELARKKAAVEATGVRVIDLSIGDTVLPAPPAAVAALRETALDARHHHYSTYGGIAPLRRAIAAWMERRFAVTLDPDTEITALMGSKEGLFRFPQAVLNGGDGALFPDPGYPVYPLAIRHAGGEALPIPLSDACGFVPDLDAIPEQTRRRTKMIVVNFPANPTAMTAPEGFYGSLYDHARRYDWVVVSDAAYCEIYEHEPPSIALQYDPRRERTIEFFSFSKSYAMTGWRLGWVCGNADLVQALLKVKGLQDSAPFEPVQYAGIAALATDEAAMRETRRFYAANRKLMKTALGAAGIRFLDTSAGFYLWARTPDGSPCERFAQELLDRHGLLVTPGTAFGPNGEGWFRIAVSRSAAEITEAAERLRRAAP